MYMYNSVSVIMAGRINFRCREAEGAFVYLQVFQFTTVNFSHVTYRTLDSAHVVYVRKVANFYRSGDDIFCLWSCFSYESYHCVVKLSASNRV